VAERFGDEGFLRAWGEAWSGGDPETLLPFYAADARYADVGNNLTVTGHDDIRRFYGWMLAFSADSRVVFDAAHGDGAGFAARWVWSGTATGPLKVGGRLYPATEAHFSVPGVAFCTLAAGGEIASHEDYYDMRAVLEQLYALPPARI
jgi:steroid delta-isomerase-like uncharacterized protein